MTDSYEGGCACGAVRYVCSAPPSFSLNCHCRDCQRATGSAYASFFVAPKSAFALSGEVRFHSRLGSSGNPVERGFCPQCGSPVMAKLGAMPDVVAVTAASLDDPSGHRPKVDVYAGSAQPWDHMDPALPKYDKGVVSKKA